MRKCVVPGCSHDGRFRFPLLDPEVFLIWKLRINNENFVGLSNQEINSKFRICGNHFTNFCFRPQSNKLIDRSLPAIDLPNFEGLPTFENSILPSNSQHLKILSGNAINIAKYGIQAANSSNNVGGRESTFEDPERSNAAPDDLNDNLVPQFTSPTLATPETIADGRNHDATPETTTPRRNTRRRLNMDLPETPKTQRSLMEHRGLLRMVSVKRSSQLTPRAKKMYRICTRMRKVARSSVKDRDILRNRLKKANKLLRDKTFLKNKVNLTTFNFICSQLKLQKMAPKGRRFSLEDKLFALSLYKQSPKTYRFLRKIFALPSKATLRTLTSNIPLRCGLNDFIINNLKQAASRMDSTDRQCVLMFDEVSLQANLQYDPQLDIILGFGDLGQGRRKQSFADHALVFMVKGLRRPWKQPICFYFNEGGVKSADLASLIKTVASCLLDIGFNVLATVCDQYSANCAAYNILIKETYEECLRSNRDYRFHDCFLIGDHEIIPIFDPPHLLKGVRNNFLDSSIRFTWKKDTPQVATWQDIVITYELDSEDSDYKMLNKLTDSHLYADKINKMKVKLAAQVFSQRVSAIMSGLARLGAEGIPSSAADTADFLLFMDKLFDSVNGSGLDNSKPLKCALTATSPHTKFWNEALPVLQSIRFVKSNKETIPPSIKNWIFTIRNLCRFWNAHSSNFNFLNLRNLNQDPLENFFGCIRSHGVRNVNPSCASFLHSFKALVINNIFMSNSPNSNCETDDGFALFTDQTLFHGTDQCQEIEEVDLITPCNDDNQSVSVTTIATYKYIAGFVARKLLTRIKFCKTCKSELTRNISGESSDFLITARSYSHKSLLYPSSLFTHLFKKYSNLIGLNLDKFSEKTHIFKIFINIFDPQDFLSLTCPSHNIQQLFSTYLLKFFTNVWINNINKSLKGLDEHKPKSRYHPLRLKACNKFLKTRKLRKSRIARSN